MRITINIETDVYVAAKERARIEGRTVGQVVSELARRGLLEAGSDGGKGNFECFGFRPFPRQGRVVSNALIDKLRQSGEY